MLRFNGCQHLMNPSASFLQLHVCLMMRMMSNILDPWKFNAMFVSDISDQLTSLTLNRSNTRLSLRLSVLNSSLSIPLGIMNILRCLRLYIKNCLLCIWSCVAHNLLYLFLFSRTALWACDSIEWTFSTTLAGQLQPQQQLAQIFDHSSYVGYSGHQSKLTVGYEYPSQHPSEQPLQPLAVQEIWLQVLYGKHWQEAMGKSCAGRWLQFLHDPELEVRLALLEPLLDVFLTCIALPVGFSGGVLVICKEVSFESLPVLSAN